MQTGSRDDFVIAIRSAFIKKENKQKFSLLGLILLTLTLLILGKYNFKVVDYLKVSLKEVAYRSSFIASVPELTPIAYLTPISSAKLCSNFSSGFPSVKSPV